MSRVSRAVLEKRAKAREYYLKNRRKILIGKRRYKKAHAALVNSQSREYYNRNKKKCAEKHAKWAAKNKKHLAEYKRKWVAKNLEHYRTYQRNWSRLNGPRIKKDQS